MSFKLLSMVAVMSLAFTTLAAPILDERDKTPYQCAASADATSKKTQLRSQGATAQDLAITILETSCSMSGTSYPLGDLLPDGTPKTGDSANFGLFKNNWANIRTYCSQFQGKQQSDWKDGQVLNTDNAAAIKCQHEQMQALGLGTQDGGFWETQRGQSGGGPSYQTAVNYILNYLNQGHTQDNWVTSYDLQNI